MTTMESDAVLRELDKRGLRAAELRELLAFGEKYPHVQREFSIAALGSKWLSMVNHLHHDYLTPVLHGGKSGRSLDLYHFDRAGWYSDSRFAAVAK